MNTCPKCGSPEAEKKETHRTWWVCGTYQTRDCHPHISELCLEREEKNTLQRERDEARAMLERKWHEEGAPLVRMMRERDEAREKIKDQAKRIKHLEGAAKMLKMTCCNELGCVEMAERVMRMLDEENLQKS